MAKPVHQKDTQLKPQDFDSIRISFASPQDITDWSYGEVTKPETINYRTQKPERDGLFDEKIFGPVKDYECYCGKYRKIRYKGVICDKCGVEITRSSVRRERMGHIDLSVPVAHIWLVRGVPSIVGMLLDLSVNDLEKVIYFAAYIVLEVNEERRKQALDELDEEYRQEKSKKSDDFIKIDEQYRAMRHQLTGLAPNKVISELNYHEISLRHGDIIKVGIGAEAIFNILKNFKAKDKLKELNLQTINASPAARRKLMRRVRLLSELNRTGTEPAWFIMTRVPVIPPDLRPMVQLDGGRFAASDLNDLYRRVINRNNRLKRLLSQGAPEVIVRNEKRMLQEAVDALIDNSARRGKTAQTTGGQRKLRSLSDMLRGKQGLFRQNLLGKRVDYSGRSVIVAGPNLKLNQCGLPKIMALELFKPFVVSRLIRDGFVHNIKNASRMIERSDPQIWDILEEITKESYVLLNRAPTLHRLGIQAFQPVLIEGKAIQIHPLVTSAYNADFDGDQMAVHVPLSKQALEEARDLMQSTGNLLKPASGEPIVGPRIDMIVGCYYLTTFKPLAPGENKTFSGKNEAILAYHSGQVNVRAKIKVRIGQQMAETSVGRILFNNILPEAMGFRNEIMDNKSLKKIVNECLLNLGAEETVKLVDKIKELGFHYAAVSGLTISMDDVYTPESKKLLLEKGQQQVEEIQEQYRQGLITEQEKDFKIIEAWTSVRGKIEKDLVDGFDKESPVYQMVTSGARGSFAQVIQMGGMKGLVVSPTGAIIPLPIRASFKEGLSVHEYFISTHGARKGKSDTSLRTSDAGYLTRRLVDVSQDVVISDTDCGADTGRMIRRADSVQFGHSFYERILGRVLLEDAEKIAKAGDMLTEEMSQSITDSEIDQIKVRSPMTCQSPQGICQRCYGKDLATGKMVKLGEAVGIIAAQAIGEPGTQLTMKTFHLGGVSGEDITTGLPRVEELFESRIPKRPAPIAQAGGKVRVQEDKESYVITLITDEPIRQSLHIQEGYIINVKNGDTVKVKQIIANHQDKGPIRAVIGGKISVKDRTVTIMNEDKRTIDYVVPQSVGLKVKNGDSVQKGQILTDDHLDLHEAIKLQDTNTLADYVMSEVQQIYMAQGQVINDKHLEIILRQMFSKVRVIDPGDSQFLTGEIVDRLRLKELNDQLENKGRKIAESENIILGITRVALKTDSFLSAASFQETTSVLIDAAIKGSVDSLKGLKENVIIGRLIPAGTGFKEYFPEKAQDANN